MTDKRGCQVIGDSLLRGEVARTLPGNYGGDFFVGNTALLRPHHVSVDFIGSSEVSTGDKVSHFSNGFRQRSRGGARFNQLHDRFPTIGSCSQGFHGPIRAPFSTMLLNPWKCCSMPALISS